MTSKKTNEDMKAAHADCKKWTMSSRRIPMSTGEMSAHPDYSSIDRLAFWRTFYYAHPPPYQKKIKVEDAIEADAAVMGKRVSVKTGPDPYVILPGVNPHQHRSFQNDYSVKRINEAMPPISLSDRNMSEKPPVYSTSTHYSDMYNAIDKRTHYNRESVHNVHPKFMRRPKPPQQFLTLPLVYSSSINNQRYTSLKVESKRLDPKDHDLWRKFSLATMIKADDLTDPKSFYRTNFPILLRTVPRRTGDHRDESEYKAMPKTPPCCQDFFDSLPLGAVESDHWLHRMLLKELEYRANDKGMSEFRAREDLI